MTTFADLQKTIVKYHQLLISQKYEWETLCGSEHEIVQDSVYAIFDFGIWDIKNEDGVTKDELTGWRLHLLHGTICIGSYHQYKTPWFCEQTLVFKCFILALLEHRLYKTTFAILLEHMKDSRCVVDLISELEQTKRVAHFLFGLINRCVELNFAEPLDAIINYKWENLFKDYETMTGNISADSFNVYNWMYFAVDSLLNIAVQTNHTECTAILLRWKNDNIFITEGGNMEL